MSSTGVATIVAMSTSHAAAPVATAGGVALGGAAVAALAGAAAIGAGIVIAKGLMWCGEKMEANYQEACQQWTKLENIARVESRANIQEVSNYLTSQLEYLSVNEFAVAEQTAAVAVSQQALERAITRAKAALADTTVIEQDKAITAQKILAAHLRAEIKTGRGILPPATIAEAEQALSGSPERIKAMLDHLESAWNAIHEKPALQTRTIQRTQQVLTHVSARLRAIDTISRDTGAARNLAYQKRLHEIENKVQEARDELRNQPELALRLATSSQQEAEILLEDTTAVAHKNWDDLGIRVNEQVGMLAGLLTMVQEAESAQLLDLDRAANLKQRIVALQQKAQGLLKSDSAQLQGDIVRLTMGVENLKQSVFAEVKTSQQHTITTIIQDTLTELGYQSDTEEPPVIKVNGDIMRVEVMASRGKAGGERDDRVISFDISRNGQVSYDFGGYIGAACLKDAREVFDALQKKGIYLVNEPALKAMQSLPVERILEEVLQQPQFQATPVNNKTQAKLAETIKGVLDKMGYPNVRVSSVGGSIELEAFEGTVGYRVVMSPEGDIQVLKDASQADITNDTNDPITRASRAVQEESREPEMKERKKSYMASRKGRMLSH